MHQKRRTKRQEKIQRILGKFKETKNILRIKSAKRRILITEIKKMKNAKSLHKLYDDTQYDET